MCLPPLHDNNPTPVVAMTTKAQVLLSSCMCMILHDAVLELG